jgi:hypothetical protein
MPKKRKIKPTAYSRSGPFKANVKGYRTSAQGLVEEELARRKGFSVFDPAKRKKGKK